MTENRYELNKIQLRCSKVGLSWTFRTEQACIVVEAAGVRQLLYWERFQPIFAADGVSYELWSKDDYENQEAVSIPVMAKDQNRILVEAQILRYWDWLYRWESEVLSPADDRFHVDKKEFQVLVRGAKDLGEAWCRIAEWFLRFAIKGRTGTGDIVQAVRHMRMMNQEIPPYSKSTRRWTPAWLQRTLQVPVELVQYATNMKLPVVNFAGWVKLQHQQMLRWWCNWGQRAPCRFRYRQEIPNEQVLLLAP